MGNTGVYQMNRLPTYLHQQAQRVFRMIDTDGSGKISRSEAMAYAQKSMSTMNVAQILQSADRNHSGKISHDEWISFWTALYNSGHSEFELQKQLSLLESSGFGGYGMNNMNTMNYGMGMNMGLQTNFNAVPTYTTGMNVIPTSNVVYSSAIPQTTTTTYTTSTIPTTTTYTTGLGGINRLGFY